MTPLATRRWRRVPVGGTDRGASLIFALLFITVVAVVIAAVIGLADTNLRATTALRQQAEQVAAADGAAKVVIEQLRASGFSGGGDPCFEDGTGQRVLSGFYHTDSGEAYSTRVECTWDSQTSFSPSPTGGGYAVLTLGTAAADGINMQANGHARVGIAGDVGSMTTLVAKNEELVITGNLSSKGVGTPPTGGCQVQGSSTGIWVGRTTPNPAIDPPINPATYPGCQQVPVYDTYSLPASLPTSVGQPNVTWPTACASILRFNPGVYPAAALNALNGMLATKGGKPAKCGDNGTGNSPAITLFDFAPGSYWFDFTGVWNTSFATTVAGTENRPTSAPAAADLETACPSPFTPAANGNTGVLFVFGNQAQWTITGDAKLAICGPKSVSDTVPSIVTWGLHDNVVVGGTTLVHAQNGCVTSLSCPVIQTSQSGDHGFYIYGLNYQPDAWFDLNLHDQTYPQFFIGGIRARRVSLFAPANSNLPDPLSSGPHAAPGQERTVVYLTIYVCPGASGCGAGGALRLRARVGFTGDDRDVVVYSWSDER